MTRPGLPSAVLALATLAAAVDGRAGSDLFGSLPGAMTSSVPRPTAGQTVSVSLQVTSDRPLKDLKVAFAVPDSCAVLEATSARKTGVSLRAGRPARFSTMVRVLRIEPCKIVASVVQTDASDARTGWVYAIVLNEVPAPNVPATVGHDAAGRPTIDAVVR